MMNGIMKKGALRETAAKRRLLFMVLMLALFCLLPAAGAQAASVKFRATVPRTKLLAGESSQIKFTNTERITYTFKSSNKKVFKVSKKEGLITAVKKGKARLTITGTWKKGSKKKVWKKTVTIQVFSCRLSSKTITLKQGKSKKLKVKDLKLKRSVTWYSDTPEICSVSSGGKVTGISRGTGYVGVQVGNAVSLRCKVTVTATALKGTQINLLVNPTHTYGAVDLAAEMKKEIKSDKKVYLTADNPLLGHLEGDIYYADAYGTNTVKASCNGYEKVYTLKQLVWSGHRGYSDMYPENTIDAFEAAGLAGAAAIETDIRVTRDLAIVCMHDNRLANMTNSSADARVSKVSGYPDTALTFEELRALQINNGNGLEKLVHKQIPTFEEYLRICRKYQMIALIEIKSIGVNQKERQQVVEEMMKLLEETGMKNRCIVISFSANLLKAFKTYAGEDGAAIPIAPLGTAWNTLKDMNLPGTYSSYSRTPFGYINGQDYSPLVGRKNKAVDSYHTRVPVY